jgi:glycerophosphoryl diester phosphodiesterase
MRSGLLAAGCVAALTTGLMSSMLPAAAAPISPPPTPTAEARTDRAAAKSRPTTTRRVPTPTLIRRATLSADFLAPGPPSGALASPANGRQGPFQGQVIPGFSGVIDNEDGTYWAMPDNGFGTKANSADFLLRLYLVQPQWETANGGAGEITIKRYISLRDPDRKIRFPLVNGSTNRRLLTGADFDIESIVRGADGSFWIGDEFGPFLLHVGANGRVLSAPVGFPGGKSPDNPRLKAGETANVPRSRGFEALAASPNGRRLYPIVEGALNNDTLKRRRMIYEFDVQRNRYTGRTWSYETDQAANVVGDAFMINNGELLLVERDDFDGAEAVTKRIYRINLRKLDDAGFVKKTLVVDLLKIANPQRIGVASSPGAYGIDSQFSFPFQSVETVVPLSPTKLLVANDNNYPGNDARYPGKPDDTEMIVLDLRTTRVGVPESLVIAHRGASGYRPEHTLAAYQLAIQQCADYIEPDLVPTKDGELVARHENEIGGTTDVATRPEFASRKTTKMVDGGSIAGWFTEDFTLAELKTLRAKERLPSVRPANTAFDGLYQIPTLDEVVDLARHSRSCSGKRVGVYPETKHPTYFASIGLAMEDRLLEVLESNDYDRANSPVIIQSFETGNLKELARKTDLPLAQLINCSGAPYDLVAGNDPHTYADLASRRGLAAISRYADGVGVCKDVMIPRDAQGRLLAPTPVIKNAHRVGLSVTGWTFRRENLFLPAQYRRGTDPNAAGDLNGEINAFLDAGMDHFFTDNPDVGDQARR